MASIIVINNSRDFYLSYIQSSSCVVPIRPTPVGIRDLLSLNAFSLLEVEAFCLSW